MDYSIVLSLVVMLITVGYFQAESSNEFFKIPAPNLSEDSLPKPEKLKTSSTLEQLVKTNSDAYVIWNITHNYNTFDPNNTKEICSWELQRNPEMIPVYLVNITFNSTEQFLQHYMKKEIKDYYGNELEYARKLYENRTVVIDHMDKYLSISKIVSRYKENQDENKRLTCISSTYCGCIQTSYFETFNAELEEFKTDTRYLWEFIIFGSYIDPLFRIIIVFAGLILNCALLYIFYKEDTVRSESNILILNLAISNILTLILFIPSNYVGTYHMEDDLAHAGRHVIPIHVLVVSANVSTVLLLNIQRYFDVSRVLDGDDVKCKLTPTSRCIVYLVVLWVWCILLALLLIVVNPHRAVVITICIYFFLYVFVFSIVLAVFNSMTARKLQHSAEQGNTVSDLNRIAGSGVVISLTATLYLTHFPFIILNTYGGLIDWAAMDFYVSSTTRTIVFLFHIMFMLHPCLNVMALHKSSSTYRYFLNEHLFRCWHNPEGRQYITMTSVQSTDSRR